MAESILAAQKGFFFALETTESTYVSPAATTYLLTEDFSCTPVIADKDVVEVWGSDVGLVQKTMHGAKSSKFSFKSPLSFPAVAPTSATVGLLNVAPLFEVCGAKPATFTAAVVGPPAVAANLQYTELDDESTAKSGSCSFRRKRGAGTHLNRKSAGLRGSVGFEWEIGKIPRFNFDLVGSHLAIASIAAMAAAATTQLSNLGEAQTADTVGMAAFGGTALCMTKMSNKNLWRMTADWTSFSCGSRAMPKPVLDNDIVVTAKYPDIAADFNPDTTIGNESSLILKILHPGTSRTLQMAYPTVQVLDYKEVEIGDELGIELTLRQTSNLTITTE